MPNRLRWRDEWSVNIATLDADHHALIDRLAAISQRFCPDASPGRVGDAEALLDVLTDFSAAVRAHFQREEDLMHACDYEGLGQHRCEHALLMAEFTSMLREWRDEGLQVFDDARQGMLRDWLLAHILGADRDFADVYLRLRDTAVRPRGLASRATRRYPSVLPK